jgi:RNA polymerase sigma-70 factor (ECF subfamily)
MNSKSYGSISLDLLSPQRNPSLDPLSNRDHHDLELLKRWRSGDRNAGIDLLDGSRQHFDRTCARFGLFDPDARLDVFQDVILRLVSGLADLPERIERSFAGWLGWQIRDAISQWRRKNRRVLDLPSTLAESESWSEQSQEILQAIRRCAEKLPPAERSVFEARFLDGQSVADIAKRLGKAANSISQAIFRLSRRMRECLENSGIMPEGNAL